jgi:hypothetical protein
MNEDGVGITAYISLFVGAILMCYCWRQLKRWSLKKPFCYWYPTIMMVAYAIVFGAADYIHSNSKTNTVLECIGCFIFGLNFPVILFVHLCLEIIPEFIRSATPHWIIAILGGVLFWLSWQFLLCFMRKRGLQKSFITLNLKNAKNE